jgi:hypothetical protein
MRAVGRPGRRPHSLPTLSGEVSLAGGVQLSAIPRSRTVVQIRANSRERADGPPTYTISCGLLKEPDKQEAAKERQRNNRDV